MANKYKIGVHTIFGQCKPQIKSFVINYTGRRGKYRKNEKKLGHIDHYNTSCGYSRGMCDQTCDQEDCPQMTMMMTMTTTTDNGQFMNCTGSLAFIPHEPKDLMLSEPSGIRCDVNDLIIFPVIVQGPLH